MSKIVSLIANEKDLGNLSVLFDTGGDLNLKPGRTLPKLKERRVGAMWSGNQQITEASIILDSGEIWVLKAYKYCKQIKKAV
jgi:hypothetical protein